MATTTPNYGLTIFEPDDKPTWQGDWNENMTKIDTAIHDASQGGGSGVEIAQTTGDSTTAVMSQNAVTTALGGKVDTSAIVQEINTSEPSATNIPSEAAVAAALGGGGGTQIATATVNNVEMRAVVIELPSCYIISFDPQSYTIPTSTNQYYFTFTDLNLNLQSGTPGTGKSIATLKNITGTLNSRSSTTTMKLAGTLYQDDEGLHLNLVLGSRSDSDDQMAIAPVVLEKAS